MTDARLLRLYFYIGMAVLVGLIAPNPISTILALALFAAGDRVAVRRLGIRA